MWTAIAGSWHLIGAKAETFGVLAFLGTLAIVAVLIPIAPRLGLIDHPDKRKIHAGPMPAIGGLGIALSVLPLAMFALPADRPLMSLVAASVLLLCEGVLDDIYDLRWTYRLSAHAAAALVLVYFGGVQVDYIGAAFGIWTYHQLGALAMPFTVLATTGLINALNMIDGVDGLAGAVTVTTLTMLACAGLYVGNPEVVTLAAMMTGGLVAFLAYNMRLPWNRKAKTFLGNAGSEFLGLVIAWCCFRLTQTHFHPVAPVLAPFLFAIPVLDCLVLMAHRLRRGRSPFAADRDHLHHLLSDAGFPVGGVILIMVCASLVIGLVAAIALLWHVPEPYFIAAFIVLLVGHFVFTNQRARAVATFAKFAALFRAPDRDYAAAHWSPSVAKDPTSEPPRAAE